LVESAQRQPSLTVLRRIANALQVPSEVLVLLGASSSSTLRSDDERVERVVRSVEKLVSAEETLRRRLGTTGVDDASE